MGKDKNAPVGAAITGGDGVGRIEKPVSTSNDTRKAAENQGENVR